MRYLLISIALILLIAACGEDNPYEPDPEPERSIHIIPHRELIDLGDSLDFDALNIYNASIPVVWEVEGIQGGNQQYGTIDSDGLYIAPNLVPEFDSVSVVATLVDDISVKDTAWAVIVDPTKIYVDTSGSDSTGTGSRFAPYRTITHAIFKAGETEIYEEILVGPGIYDLAGNESFPIEIGLGTSLVGAGYDSTTVIGPGNTLDREGSVFAIELPDIQVKDFKIETENSDGIGIWVEGLVTSSRITNNEISSNHTGIYVAGSLTSPRIMDNIIKRDSIGIYTANTSRPIIMGNRVDSCWTYGVQIDDSSVPDMGRNDSTFAGENTFVYFNTSQYLIHNSSPDTIWAVGNTWENVNNDPDAFIYDDEESGGASGPVITENP
jgi:parallel beta-helix repeat protein